VYLKFSHYGYYTNSTMALDDIRVSNVDVFGPQVTSQSPTGQVPGPAESVTVTFNEQIGSFPASQARIVGPAGNQVALDPVLPIEDSGDHRTFTIHFASGQSLAGTYRVYVDAGVLDLAGNQMNQNQDSLNGDGYSGTFSVGPVVAQGFPYTQDFDDDGGDIGALAGWSFSAASGSVSVTDAYSPHSPPYHLFFDSVGASGDREAVLKLDLSGQVGRTDLYLDFWLKAVNSTSSNSYMKLYVSGDGSNWGSEVEWLRASGIGTSYHHYPYDLDQELGTRGIALDHDVYVRFLHTGNGTSASYDMALDDIRVKAGPLNHAPTLTTISTLTGATENQAFPITYDTLASAANEADSDGDSLSFRVESVTSGTLAKVINGGNVPVVPGVTTLGTGESLVWVPADAASGTPNAFTVRAWDGDLASGEPIQVKVNVATIPYTAASYSHEAIDLVAGVPGVVTIVDNADNGTATIPLGTNTFNFYGASYTGSNTLYVSSNGLITFSSANSTASNKDLSSSPSQASIAPLWDDWTTTGTNDVVLYKFEDTNGDATPDRLIIEWSQVRNNGSPSTGDATFQAILQLNTGISAGVISLNYSDLDVGNSTYNNGASATVGVKGTSGQPVTLVSYNSGSNPLVQSGTAIRLTQSADASPATVHIVDVAPDPRSSAVDQISIEFSEPVSGFQVSDLRLTRDGGANLLTTSQTLATVDNATWILGNLATLTNSPGTYLLSLVDAAPRIVDSSWNLLSTGDSDTWTVVSGNLDADGNGTADALSDGILILRYLFDPAGAWNYADALGAVSTRTTRAAIKTFLDSGRTTVLDVDGNGNADALTDGILILRYLFDPSGAWNYADALGAGATRTTRVAIKSYLDQFNPALQPLQPPPLVPTRVPATASAVIVSGSTTLDGAAVGVTDDAPSIYTPNGVNSAKAITITATSVDQNTSPPVGAATSKPDLGASPLIAADLFQPEPTQWLLGESGLPRLVVGPSFAGHSIRVGSNAIRITLGKEAAMFGANATVLPRHESSIRLLDKLPDAQEATKGRDPRASDAVLQWWNECAAHDAAIPELVRSTESGKEADEEDAIDNLFKKVGLSFL
jgi:hypothetical protein